MLRRITGLIKWIASKFNREEIELIIAGLKDVLAGRDAEVKPRDDFKKNIRTTASGQ
jgi:hypothetical protein